jgi:uncharacterized membrane protein
MVVMLAPQYCYLSDMSLRATLSPQRLSVEPGNPSQWELLVDNTGDAPEQVAVRVAGEAADWISAFPRAMELPPGEEGSVRLVVRVPAFTSSERRDAAPRDRGFRWPGH